MIKLSPASLQLIASILWTMAGLKLLYRGVTIVVAAQYVWWVILVTVVVGLLKSRLILDNVCRVNVARLHLFSENATILHVFPLRTWLIIGVMIIFGRLLRMCPSGGEWSGLFSLAVGCGLLFASRISWKGWWDLRAG